jgi:hypothetical protein
MTLVYLYSYRLPVQLTMTDHGVSNHNMPLINYAVKVYKNNFNVIDFVIRNNDRKPVNLIDCTLSVLIQNASSTVLMLEKGVNLIDEVRGRAQLILTPDDVRNWSLGGYQYNVRIQRPDGQGGEFLYLDINNNTFGTFDLLESVGGSLIPAQTLLATQLTPITTDWDEMTTRLISGAISGTNAVGNNSGLFSVVLYQNHWAGTFSVQGSLSNLAPTERSWFDIEIASGVTADGFDGGSDQPRCWNFTINVRWIRFVLTPSQVNPYRPGQAMNLIPAPNNSQTGAGAGSLGSVIPSPGSISVPSGSLGSILYKIS